MDPELFEHHLTSAYGRGRAVAGGATGVAGTRLCGDVVRFALALDADGVHVAEAGWEAEACGATIAAASATVELVTGAPLLDVARIGAHQVADALGGLSPGKLHAAELVADALARALGTAAARDAALPAPGEVVDNANAGSNPAPNTGPRTLVAMSGGVDSAVAALLSARDETEVVAVTLELWADEQHDEERSCCSAQAVRGARALAHRMGIPHFTLDLRDEFRAGVVEPFLEDHRAGLTPNPCISCNGHVRLDAMLDLADRLGAATLATGHYARVLHEPAADAAPDAAGPLDAAAAPDADAPDASAPGPARPLAPAPLLVAAADAWKDQTYMLAALSPSALLRLRFPLGDLDKPAVRKLAAEAGLPVASKADSQDLCFLAGTSRAAFLARHAGIDPMPGEIVDVAGAVIGSHAGHHGYTVGQRRGLGVAAPEPLYVLATEARTNRVVAGTREQLRTTRVGVRGARLHRDGARVDRVKLRYRSKPLPARLLGDPAAGTHKRLEIELAEPVDGAAPGQMACLMDGDAIVGWATIERQPA